MSPPKVLAEVFIPTKNSIHPFLSVMNAWEHEPAALFTGVLRTTALATVLSSLVSFVVIASVDVWFVLISASNSICNIPRQSQS